MAETKGVGALQIKDAARGEVEAVIATLNVVDRDQEVVVDGAIRDGAEVTMSSFGHDAMFGSLPVGKGVIRIAGNLAIFEGKLFLSTARGQETFDVLKEMGPRMQWSFGFSVLESATPSEEWRARGARRMLTKLDAFEVSPVILGAGVGTQTLAVKHATQPSELLAIHAQHLAREKQFADVLPAANTGGDRAELREMHDRTIARGKDLAARDLRRELPGYPPSMEFSRFIAFAKYHLGIDPSDAPRVVMVKEFPDDPAQVGGYTPGDHLVRIRDNQSNLDTRRTLAHELAHAKEALEGWTHSEEYAEIAAEDVLAAWNRFCYS